MKTILVIDDQRFIIRLLQFMLQGAGYDVLTAMNGQEALDLLQETVPDLIICDIMMPNMDGFTLMESIRADERLAALPIIVLTAKGQSEDIELAWRLGAKEYLTKPFSSAQVLESVARHLAS